MTTAKPKGSKVDHASKGMMPLAIDNTCIAQCSWLVRTSLRGASQVAIKWRMAVVYAR